MKADLPNLVQGSLYESSVESRDNFNGKNQVQNKYMTGAIYYILERAVSTLSCLGKHPIGKVAKNHASFFYLFDLNPFCF